jgi:hypothetical protein
MQRLRKRNNIVVTRMPLSAIPIARVHSVLLSGCQEWLLCRKCLLCLGVVFAVGLLSVAPAHGEPRNSVEAFLVEYRRGNGVGASHDAFTTFLSQNATTWSAEAVNNAWRAWFHEQKPWISSTQLAELLQARRDSISSLRILYHHSMKEHATSTRFSYSTREEFALSGEKALIRSIWETESGEDKLLTYDGQVERRFYANTMSGTIRPHDTMVRFYMGLSPFTSSLLCDSEADYGSIVFSRDVIALLKRGVLHEQPVDIAGVECFVVSVGTPIAFKAYLDPKRDFSVLRYEEYWHRRAENGLPTESFLSVRWDNEGLIHYGNGLWLPSQVVRRSYVSDAILRKRDTFLLSATAKAGDLFMEEFVALESATLNEKIDDAVFSDTFPRGARIVDRIANLAYLQGDPFVRPETILDALDSVVEMAEEKVYAFEESSPHSGNVDASDSIPREEGHAPNSAILRWWMLLTALSLCIMVFLLVVHVRYKKTAAAPSRMPRDV